MEDFPLSPGALERFRLAIRRRAPAGQVGSHLLRRRGQSLEFRDYEPYIPGDDYRHIDWRASARQRRPGELLVRRFEAEERLTLTISIDSRPSMALLPEAPKARLAAWLAYALATIAASEGDRVWLHRLFHAPGPGAQEIRGRAGLPRAHHFLKRLRAEPADEEAPLELRTLEPLLPPAAVWIVVTDLYFDDPGDRLAAALARAQRGMRQVLLVDLDNWPQEKAHLGLGARRIEGPGLAGAGSTLELEIDDEGHKLVERHIRDHKDHFLERIRRGGLEVVHWPWPTAEEVDLADLFRQRFFEQPALQRLFRRRW